MSNVQYYARKRAERIENIEFLKSQGVTPYEIAGRLGSGATDRGLISLAKNMYRAGRPDLACWLQNALNLEHTHI